MIDEGLKWVKYRLKKNKSHHFSKNQRPPMSEPEGISNNALIRDHTQWLSPGPTEKKIRHFPQDSFLGHFYLGNLIIDRKKRSRDFWLRRAEMGQRTGPKKIRENSRKENHRFSKNERPRMS